MTEADPINAQRTNDAYQAIDWKDPNKNFKRRAVEEGFAEYLRLEYLPEFVTQEQSRLVYALAYEEGHANGFPEVENCYSRLATLLTTMFPEGLK